MGVAIGSPHGVPVCHTEELGPVGSGQAARFCQLMRIINTLIADHDPAVIAIEQPIAGGVVGKAARVEQAFGYRGCIFGLAHLRRIDQQEYTVHDIRKHMIGVGNLKSALAKSAIYDKCGAYGWSVSDYEQSDAAAVWHYARFKIYGVTGSDDLFGVSS